MTEDDVMNSSMQAMEEFNGWIYDCNMLLYHQLGSVSDEYNNNRFRNHFKKGLTPEEAVMKEAGRVYNNSPIE